MIYSMFFLTDFLEGMGPGAARLAWSWLAILAPVVRELHQQAEEDDVNSLFAGKDRYQIRTIELESSRKKRGGGEV